MEGDKSRSSQQMRDTRRVLQVLLPGLPPPAIDLAMNTVFASMNTSTNRQANGKFKLRRMDSGDLSQYSLVSPVGKRDDKFCDPSKFQFGFAEQARQ